MINKEDKYVKKALEFEESLDKTYELAIELCDMGIRSKNPFKRQAWERVYVRVGADIAHAHTYLKDAINRGVYHTMSKYKDD